MATEELLKTKFNKHPEFSINGNTSLDDEFLYMIVNDPHLDCLINMDIDKSTDPLSIYVELIIKLCIFEAQDIETLITDYKSSKIWDSLDPVERRELIDETLSIQEEQEQEALESIGVESIPLKRSERSAYFTWQKGL